MWLLFPFAKALTSSVQIFRFFFLAEGERVSLAVILQSPVYTLHLPCWAHKASPVTFGSKNSFQVHLKFNPDCEDSPSHQHLHYYQLAEEGEKERRC